MNDEMIARINTLYNKAKNEGLSDAEKLEQTELRQAYVQAMRRNMKSHLDNITIVDEDGNCTNLGEKHQAKYGDKKEH